MQSNLCFRYCLKVFKPWVFKPSYFFGNLFLALNSSGTVSIIDMWLCRLLCVSLLFLSLFIFSNCFVLARIMMESKSISGVLPVKKLCHAFTRQHVHTHSHTPSHLGAIRLSQFILACIFLVHIFIFLGLFKNHMNMRRACKNSSSFSY